MFSIYFTVQKQANSEQKKSMETTVDWKIPRQLVSWFQAGPFKGQGFQVQYGERKTIIFCYS